MADINLDFDKMLQSFRKDFQREARVGDDELLAFIKTDKGQEAFEAYCDNYIKEQLTDSGLIEELDGV